MQAIFSRFSRLSPHFSLFSTPSHNRCHARGPAPLCVDVSKSVCPFPPGLFLFDTSLEIGRFLLSFLLHGPPRLPAAVTFIVRFFVWSLFDLASFRSLLDHFLRSDLILVY